MMKAWLLQAFEGVDQLVIQDVPDPKPAANEILLRLELAALNPADRYLAQGRYPAKPPLPHILGRDGVGTVEQIGDGVHDHAIGDRRLILRGDVGVNRWGTFAEKVAVPIHSLVELPTGWTSEQSAG